MAVRKKVRIFISSPGDVAEERDRARRVIEKLQRYYLGQLELEPILWEDSPLEAVKDFQEGIEIVLSKENGVDIAVFIIWTRLGSQLGPTFAKTDGTPYRSGTEREFDLMLQARKLSNENRPSILVYLRDDKNWLKGESPNTDEVHALLEQKLQAEAFVQEYFYDVDTKTNLRAFHTFDLPTTFSSRLRVHLKSKLDELAMAANSPARFWDVEDQGSPYRGLEFFDVNHSRIFFGREQEVSDVQVALQRLGEKGRGFVLLVGASGSGKSSLVRAGVIPAFQNFDEDSCEWRYAILSPGQSPKDLCLGLASALFSDTALPELDESDASLNVFAEGLKKDPQMVYQLGLSKRLGHSAGKHQSGRKLLLLVDQLEELFTYPDITREDVELFLNALEALCSTGNIYILATIRSDYYGKVQEFPGLMELKEGGQIDVLPPTSSNLMRIIVEPALLAGLRFEDRGLKGSGLEHRIYEDAVKYPDSLPLVQYVLSELFEQSNETGGVLTFAGYESLGCLEGAIGFRAEAEFKGLSESARAAAPSVFRSLASVGTEGQFISQSVQIGAFSREASSVEVIERFSKSRLLVSSSDSRSLPTVRIAHEAILKSWRRLGDWLEEGCRLIELRKKLKFTLKPSLDSRGGLLAGYFEPNLDLLSECEALSQEPGIFREEAEFLFRSSLTSGISMLKWSRRLESDFPEARSEIVEDVFHRGPIEARVNIASLLSVDPDSRALPRLVDLLIYDESDLVRRAAARSLIRINRFEVYEESIKEALADPESRTKALSALADLRVVCDRELDSQSFDYFFELLSRKEQSLVNRKAAMRRTREGLSAIPCLAVPAGLIAALLAASYKWLPSLLDWSIVQHDDNPVIGMFHGVVAGIIWAGGVALGLSFYHVAFSKIGIKRSMRQPFGAILFAGFSGFLSSLLIVLTVAWVYNPKTLFEMGWIDSAENLSRLSRLENLFMVTRFGWAHLLTGTGIGVGMALTLNGILSSSEWHMFLKRQTRLVSFGQVRTIIKDLVRLTFKRAWTIPLCIGLAAIIAFSVVRKGGSDSETDPPVSDYRSKNHSAYGIAMGLFGDCSTQALGASFAIVGMGFGFVVRHCGLQVKPQTYL